MGKLVQTQASFRISITEYQKKTLQIAVSFFDTMRRMTENFALVLRGFIIGISIAAPVGPIGVLCIRRTLSDGRLTGLLSGLGAATADMIYGAVAAFGLTVIMNALLDQKFWLQLIGGFFLLYLGIKTLLSKPAEEAAQTNRNGLLGAYFSTLLLTLTNPMTILSFIAIFAGAMPSNTTGTPMILVIGVFAGSAAWWLALSLGVGLMRERVSPNLMLWINRISGIVITIFGAVSLLSIDKSQVF
jgi:threonine/homoserine/homoserine lactone efflux protein